MLGELRLRAGLVRSDRAGAALLRHWTLRRRLLVAVLVSFLPLLASAYHLIDESVAQTKASILSDSLLTAEAAEARVSSLIAITNQSLATLADQPALRIGDAPAANELLREARSSYPELLRIVATDATGKVFAMAAAESDAGQDDAERQYWLRLLPPGWPTVPQTRLNSTSNASATVLIAIPIKNPVGLRIGLLVGELSLQALQTRVGPVNRRSLGTVVLVDGQGTILSYPDWRRIDNDGGFAYPLAAQAALRGGRGSFELDDDQTGERALVAYVPVAGTSWALTVIRPVDEAYLDVREQTFHSLATLAIGICAALVLTIFLLPWIARPLHVLGAKARAVVAGGNLGEPQRADGDDLRQLTTAFDTLAGMLESRATQLADLKREVESRNVRLKRLAATMINGEQEQRAKIARDMHSGVAQLLAMAGLEAQQAAQFLRSDTDRAAEKIQSTLQFVREADGEVRRDLFELRPPPVGAGALPSWLKDYLDRYGLLAGLDCQLDVEGTPIAIGSTVEQVVCHVVTESLHNVRKHARATIVRCTLSFGPSAIRLVIADDGQGIDNDRSRGTPGHLGLIDMEDQVREVGGSISIGSESGGGTTVDLLLPLAPRTKRRPRVPVLVDAAGSGLVPVT